MNHLTYQEVIRRLPGFNGLEWPEVISVKEMTFEDLDIKRSQSDYYFGTGSYLQKWDATGCKSIGRAVVSDIIRNIPPPEGLDDIKLIILGPSFYRNTISVFLVPQDMLAAYRSKVRAESLYLANRVICQIEEGRGSMVVNETGWREFLKEFPALVGEDDEGVEVMLFKRPDSIRFEILTPEAIAFGGSEEGEFVFLEGKENFIAKTMGSSIAQIITADLGTSKECAHDCDYIVSEATIVMVSKIDDKEFTELVVYKDKQGLLKDFREAKVDSAIRNARRIIAEFDSL